MAITSGRKEAKMHRVACSLAFSLLIVSILTASPSTVFADDSKNSNQSQQKATNLWEYYTAAGKPLPKLSERAEMYQALGLGPASSYTGTASQNTALLNALKQRGITPATGEEAGFKASQTSLTPTTKTAPTSATISTAPAPATSQSTIPVQSTKSAPSAAIPAISPPAPQQPSSPSNSGKQATNLWEYYTAAGKPLPKLSERAEMYQALGLGPASSYTGTASQNTALLNALKQRGITPATGEEAGFGPSQLTATTSTTKPASTPVPTSPIQVQPPTGSAGSRWDWQSDFATLLRKSIEGSGAVQDIPKALRWTPILAVVNYAKEAEKEGVTLRDMAQAWRDLPDIVSWAKSNPDQALDALADGMARAATVGVNGWTEESGVSQLIRLATAGKVDPQITSQQIRSIGQSIGEKIGEIDWKSLPLLR